MDHEHYTKEKAVASLHKMINDKWIDVQWPNSDGAHLYSISPMGNYALSEAYRYLAVVGGTYKRCPCSEADCDDLLDTFAYRHVFSPLRETYFL
jgi:hypothetical protein